MLAVNLPAALLKISIVAKVFGFSIAFANITLAPEAVQSLVESNGVEKFELLKLAKLPVAPPKS